MIYLQVNVAWQLADSPPSAGGFVVAAGSHKAQYPLPEAVRWADDRTSLREVPMQVTHLLFHLLHNIISYYDTVTRLDRCAEFSCTAQCIAFCARTPAKVTSLRA